MLFSNADEIFDAFKMFVPYYLLIALPLMIIISPVNPVAGAQEFPAFRMQQYDLHGVPHGCRSSIVSLDGRGLSSWSSSRHCVLARIEDLTEDLYRDIRTRAGALLVILPKQEEMAKLSDTAKQHILSLESAMMQQETQIPVYFSHWTPEIQSILEDIDEISPTSNQKGTAAEAMINQISANGYQIVVGAGHPSVRTEISIANIHGKLVGNGHEDKLPTVVIAAHYDSFAVIPGEAYGANSNAAGVAMLLELARLMSSLYSDTRTHPRYNLVFLLTGGGKMNYQGSKKWLEDQVDGENALPQDSTYVLCLDSIAGSGPIYYHVSKPPKEGSVGDRLIKSLNTAAEQEEQTTSVLLNHKKINLAEETLAWEHERFSMKRLPAATLSTIKSHKDFARGSILDTKDQLDVSSLARNTRVVAEALGKHIFALNSGKIFSDQLGVDENSLQMWIDYLASMTRATHIVSHKNHQVVGALKDTLAKYVKGVKVTYMVPDRRDPELAFYDPVKTTVNVYSVKPAIFDLILTFAIVAYLLIIYLVLQNFSSIYSLSASIVGVRKNKSD
ncbi:Nicalin-1 [Frankliniella fusca]|uniref:BOS complex subunit NCLN n=1 Tax=Frankliniella fusca TaxID=407009 RepID=A0AAE1I3Z6_9NEOP|nr:Nicalin-1 [Frankliniella fusca]